MENPILQWGLVGIFLLALVRLVVISPSGVRLPRPGDVASTNHDIRRPVRCKKPNPSLERQRLEAHSSSRAIYLWERPNSNVWSQRLRDAFTALATSLARASTLEHEVEMLLRSSDDQEPDNRPLVRDSEFYEGKTAPSDRPDLEAPPEVDREQQTAFIVAKRKELFKIRVEAWSNLIDTLGLSRLGLDDRECLRLLSDPAVRDQVLRASLQVLLETRSWLLLDAFDPRFKQDRLNGIVLNDTGQLLPPESSVMSYVEAVDAVHSSLADAVIGQHFPNLVGTPLLRQLVKNIVAGQLRSNFHRNEEATREARDRAESAVSLTLPVAFNAGDTIITRGERAEGWQVECLERAYLVGGEGDDGPQVAGVTLERIVAFFGRVLLVAGFVFLPFFFLKVQRPRVALKRRDVAVAAALLLIQAALFYLAVLLMGPLRGAFPGLSEAAIMVGIPVSLTPIVLNVLVGGAAPFLSAVVVALLATLAMSSISPMDFGGNFPPPYMVHILVSGMVGIIATRKVSSRAALARAGVVVGVAGVLYWMAVYMAHMGSNETGQLQVFIAALLSGLLSYAGSIALVPTFESIFGYLTDMKLMEYVNLNHPALKELYEKARGTYDHSANVAKLAEVASEKVGANALLAKAGSYFHDLGKLRAKEVGHKGEGEDRGLESPHYFVENQSDGINPHDHLSPSMSARIVRRHVEKSLEEIRRYRLGVEIEDIAAQHHGTTVMQYFHSRALDQARDPSLVNIDDYRYPGPKPQTKEGGIVMLADTIEAAVRAMKDHSEGRIKARIEQLINAKIEDKQLDECPLTFQELGMIRESFVAALVSQYHGRISYPDKRKDQSTVRIKKSAQDLHDLVDEIDREPSSTGTTPELKAEKDRNEDTNPAD
ncbi:MAG: HDIG domain-containing metalloprotein [Pseudomonadota bacterium]